MNNELNLVRVIFQRFSLSLLIVFSLSLRVSESTSTDEEEIRQRIDQEYRAATFLDECLPPNDVLAKTGTESQPEDLRNDHGSLSEDTISDVSDTDIDDFVDQMNKEDKNKTIPLYSGSPISIIDACTRLIRLANALNLDKTKLQTLLKELRCFFPLDCRLPKTTFMLFKMTGNDDCSTVCKLTFSPFQRLIDICRYQCDV
jgi:hypothetical protein